MYKATLGQSVKITAAPNRPYQQGTEQWLHSAVFAGNDRSSEFTLTPGPPYDALTATLTPNGPAGISEEITVKVTFKCDGDPDPESGETALLSKDYEIQFDSPNADDITFSAQSV